MARAATKKAIGVFEKVPDSGVWWVRYRSGGQLHREKVGRKQDAIDLYHKRKAEIRAGIKLPNNMRTKSTTFAAIAEAGLKWSKQHKLDWKNDELRIPAIVKAFGAREADSIKPAELDEYITAHAKAPATQNRLRSLFSMIYREALRNGKVTGNPARLVRMRHVDANRIRFLTDKEESKLIRVIERLFPHHLDSFLISLHTGMRLSEQFTLEWSQIDFALKMIHLDRTKNGSDRHIPLNSTTLAALNRLKSRAPKGCPYVFLTLRRDADGNPVRIKTPRTWYEDVIAESKLKDVTWHVCRHTFISRLVMAGVDLRTVMELAGHKSMAMTIRYAHLAPEHTASAIERIARVSDQVSPQVSPRKKGRSGRSGQSLVYS